LLWALELKEVILSNLKKLLIICILSNLACNVVFGKSDIQDINFDVPSLEQFSENLCKHQNHSANCYFSSSIMYHQCLKPIFGESRGILKSLSKNQDKLLLLYSSTKLNADCMVNFSRLNREKYSKYNNTSIPEAYKNSSIQNKIYNKENRQKSLLDNFNLQKDLLVIRSIKDSKFKNVDPFDEKHRASKVKFLNFSKKCVSLSKDSSPNIWKVVDSYKKETELMFQAALDVLACTRK